MEISKGYTSGFSPADPLLNVSGFSPADPLLNVGVVHEGPHVL